MANDVSPKPRAGRSSKVADFDEQLWPISFAVFILSACVVGIVVNRGNFSLTEAGWLNNGYLQLAVVALLLGILIWAVVWLQGKMARRVQLCVLFSLLVHLWLAMYLHAQYLAIVAGEEWEKAQKLARLERITVPDYQWHHPDQPKTVHSFEKPVSTDGPKETSPQPIEMEAAEQETDVERPGHAEPDTPEPLPDPIEVRRAELTDPARVSPAAEAEMSRQASTHRPQPDPSVLPPDIPPPAAETPSDPESQITAIPRDLTTARIDQRREFQRPPSGIRPQQAAVPERRVAVNDRPSRLALVPSQPSTLARVPAGVDLPSIATSAEDVVAPAAPGGATPSRIELASAVAAVQRWRDMTLQRPSTAAAGSAEFALGSSRIQALLGQPHAVGEHQPSVEPDGHVRRIARASSGAPIPTTPSVEVLQVDSETAAFGSGGPSTQLRSARGTPIGPAGSMGIPTPAMASLAGSGPESSAGMSGRAANVPLAHLTGRATLPPAEAGGGLPMPARRFGRALSADATVEVPQPARDAPSGGIASGPPSDASLSGPQRPAVGLPGTRRAWAAPGSPAALGFSGSATPAAAARRAIASQEPPGRVGISPNTSATLVKATAGPALPAAASPLEDVPVPGAGGLAAPQGGQPSSLEPGPAAAIQRAVADVPIDRALGSPALAARDPGGLSGSLPLAVGTLDRRRGPAGEVLQPASQGLLAKRSGRRPTVDERVRELAAEAFRQRDPGRRSELAKQYGSTEGSERAVEMGLDFLARLQFPDGHWSFDQLPQGNKADYAGLEPGQMHADTAATGLALLAFLGAGYTHLDNQHRAVVQEGIDWLVANQQPNGQLFTIPTDTERAGRVYGHGIGAIALCEAYGMTQDPQLRQPAQKAIEFICAAQHPTQGGWRYTKRDDETTWRKESDTSVSGWMVMALKSAQMAGLEVPSEVMEKAGHWLDLAQAENGSRYVYNPYASDTPSQRQGRFPNLAMTAEGLLMRMYLGWDRNHPAMIAGADYLKQSLPEISTRNPSLRDAYYWYYATQVMFQMQGGHWTAWNERLRPLLQTSQVQRGPLAGSWHPEQPVPDRWAHAGGRLYATTLNLLMLEVYYRYLPLFQTLAGDAVGSG